MITLAIASFVNNGVGGREVINLRLTIAHQAFFSIHDFFSNIKVSML